MIAIKGVFLLDGWDTVADFNNSVGDAESMKILKAFYMVGSSEQVVVIQREMVKVP